jgi:hypothetical protein
MRLPIWGNKVSGKQTQCDQACRVTPITSELGAFKSLSPRSWPDDDYDVFDQPPAHPLRKKKSPGSIRGFWGCG